MKISLIAAVAQNNAIGKNNRLIWRLPADMSYFREKTTGHCVITGRRNYESIPEKFRPLPDRINIVVSRNKSYPLKGAVLTHSVEEAIAEAKKMGETEAFIIGGADIYRQTIGIADKIYLTEVHASFDADAFFPDIDKNLWKEIKREDCKADEKHPYDYSFVELVRGNA